MRIIHFDIQVELSQVPIPGRLDKKKYCNPHNLEFEIHLFLHNLQQGKLCIINNFQTCLDGTYKINISST